MKFYKKERNGNHNDKKGKNMIKWRIFLILESIIEKQEVSIYKLIVLKSIICLQLWIFCFDSKV